MMRFNFWLFLASLYVSFSRSRAAEKLFVRKIGTPDYIDTLNWPSTGFNPVTRVPIYAHECLDKDCSRGRFLTMRFKNIPILQFSNFWSDEIYRDESGWHTRCPKNMLAMGISCPSEQCVIPQLHCGLAAPDFKIVPSKNKQVTPSKKKNSAICPNGMYVQGVDIASGPSYRSGLYCVSLLYKPAFATRNPLIPSDNRITTSELVRADKSKGRSESMDGPIFSIIYAKEREGFLLVSVNRGVNPILGPVKTWTDYAGEDKGTVSCPRGTIIKQIRCSQNICDKISLGCAKPTKESEVEFHDSDVLYSNVVGSNHALPAYCPEGYYAKEVNCLLDHCSQLILGCVKATYIQ